MNTKFIWGAVIVVIIGLFIWGRAATPTSAETFTGTDVPCLPNGHQTLSEHIHPVLSISVDGVSESIPANIGVTGSCMAEVHTHDATGTLHVESAYMGNIGELRLSDFFDVWDQEFTREGYDAEIRVGGNVVESPEGVRFRDGEQIAIVYTSIEDSSNDIATTTESDIATTTEEE